MSRPGPLDGLTIVDLTRVLSGPYCTMLLADIGGPAALAELGLCASDIEAVEAARSHMNGKAQGLV